MGETVKDMLVRQGIEAGRAGNTGRHGKIARTAGTGAAGIGADDQGEEPGRPLTGLREGGDRNPMGISMEKDGAAKPRQFNREEVSNHAQEPSMARSHPVLRLVVSNKDVRRRDPTSVAPLGLRTSLVLMVSR